MLRLIVGVNMAKIPMYIYKLCTNKACNRYELHFIHTTLTEDNNQIENISCLCCKNTVIIKKEKLSNEQNK